MMLHDVLADALSILDNAESVGKESCLVPKSKLVLKVLEVIKDEGYISSFSEENGKIKVAMLGRINKIKIIKPRFSVKKGDYDRWERQFLPSRDMGILVVSTPKGIKTQKKAWQEKTGGKLLAFVY